MNVKEKQAEFGTYKGFTIAFSGLIMYLLDMFAFFMAGLFLLLGEISVGSATAFLNYIQLFIEPIRNLIDHINSFHSAKPSINRITDLLLYDHNELILTSHIDYINYKQVTKHYDSISMEYNYQFNDDTYLIIGDSGSGKSTLLDMLVKQLSYNGDIYINNFNIQELDTKVLIDGVYHGHHIYNDSFINNISMFESYDINWFYDYIKQYPNHQISELMNVENCMNCSNGQKQMILIIRSLSSKAQAFIFDEAISAMDDIQKEYFMQMILSINKLTIMVSHDHTDSFKTYFKHLLKIKEGKIYPVY